MLQTHPELVYFFVRLFPVFNQPLQPGSAGAELLLEQLVAHFIRHEALVYAERVLLDARHLGVGQALDIGAAEPCKHMELHLVGNLQVLPV